MNDKKVKVAIIGAGTAGLSAFKEVYKVTPDCVLVNGGPYGTTCARVGCMPSKVFIQIANNFHNRHSFKQQGINNSDKLTLDKVEMMKYVRSLRDSFVSGVLKSIGKIGDKNIEGFARFVEPNVLVVEGRKVIADTIIIANGSSPTIPKLWQDYRDKIITTDDIFEQEILHDDMAVIGAGAIGLELGLALSRMDINVTMAEGTEFIGGLSDPVVNQYAVNTIKEDLNLYTGHMANLSYTDNDLELSCKQEKCIVNKALVAIGRKPNIHNLGLENIGIELNEKGIPEVDYNTLQIKNVPIFIAGDVNGHRPILHEAADEGRIAGYNAVRSKAQCFRRRTSLSIAFTEPQIVIAGKRYKEIEKLPHIIGATTFDNQSRSRIMHKNKGILRIYAEPQWGKLLGAEMMVPEGEYIGHLLAWAIQKELTAFEVLNMPFYHPTVLEGLRSAIRDLASKVKNHTQKFELAPCD
ncbi:MAG: dihydrolipoyl dehydrogenase [Spirochaetaceae bacterium]|jgi:dihydrolipoamide dehydrogenase|nr:dihydrolipoyl dehydrogenase [Spirochaetaceae bacterium]